MKNFKKYLFTGLMSIIPISITFWIINKLFIFFSIPGQKLLNIILSYPFIKKYTFLYLAVESIQNFVGFLLTIIFLYILGLIVTNVFGKKIYSYFENILSNIPIINKIYKTTKNIIRIGSYCCIYITLITN